MTGPTLREPWKWYEGAWVGPVVDFRGQGVLRECSDIIVTFDEAD
jgi:hypothetical protein